MYRESSKINFSGETSKAVILVNSRVPSLSWSPPDQFLRRVIVGRTLRFLTSRLLKLSHEQSLSRMPWSVFLETCQFVDCR